ncbi:AI-2E family transporter [candidate division GN15 bacterium]|nr:AI-2E family transporter [candidate division GN15 bacterium]
MSSNTNGSLNFSRKILTAVGIVAIFALVVYLLGSLAQMLLGVFAGVLLAVLLDGLTGWLQTVTRLPRILTLWIVILLLLGLGGLIGWLLGPRIAEQFVRLSERLPDAYESIRESLRANPWGRQLLQNVPTLDELVTPGSEVMGRVAGVFSTTVGALLSALLVLFVGLYLAIDPRLYIDNAIRLVPENRRKRAREISAAIGHALRWWLAGRFASMAVVGLLTGIGLWIAGVPLAFTLGLIAAVLSFVPFVGPIISAIPAVLVALAESPILAVYVVIVYAAVQAMESYLITPLIQKRAVSLPPALLIVVQVVMGVLFGALGVFLATPFAVAVIVVIQMLYVEDVLGDSVTVMGEH